MMGDGLERRNSRDGDTLGRMLKTVIEADDGLEGRLRAGGESHQCLHLEEATRGRSHDLPPTAAVEAGLLDGRHHGGDGLACLRRQLLAVAPVALLHEATHRLREHVGRPVACLEVCGERETSVGVG